MHQHVFRAVLTFAAVLLAAQLAQSASLRSLVETEYAFAAAVDENGMRYAYLYHLADDAIGFEPGPTLLKPRWQNRLPTQDKLRWYPVYAVINAAGDLGFTTGPWTYTGTATGNVGYGDFVTIWRHDPADGWRIALQDGVTHEAPAQILKPVRAGRFSNRALEAKAGEAAAIRSAVDACDDTYSDLVVHQGTAAAIRQFGRRDLRAYVLGQQTARDRRSALTMLTAFAGAESAQRGFTGTGGSADLGYTYGTIDFAQPGPQHYLRIWRVHGTRCELALEMLRPQAYR
jgi:ketosteroid isomerase-like protein